MSTVTEMGNVNTVNGQLVVLIYINSSLNSGSALYPSRRAALLLLSV